ncbi:MAG: SDR family oxidoreductase [Mesorhizobium sp.]|nr:SDR family oxidoreductase [Mesorhizobium sp.]MBL8580330.1 SDR family oxidoreductase [Mesorhizobium sp.]
MDTAEQRTALVTGAGGGMGRVIAHQLAQRGVRIAIADLNADGLAETAKASDTVLHLAGDLNREDASDNAIRAVVERWGHLDILVNNAGYGVIEPFLEMTRKSWERTLGINVTALAMLTVAAGRVMKDAGRGRIVNITSPASRMALPNYAAYSASKAAVDSITRAAAVALAPHGVQVNSLAPGMMDTEMQRSTEATMARIEGREDFETFLAERTKRIPLGRRAEISEIAAAVVWLALDAPDYLVAERLNMSGGLDKD